MHKVLKFLLYLQHQTAHFNINSLDEIKQYFSHFFMSRYAFLLVTLLFLSVQSFAQTKRALVIGLGEQQDKEWAKINGDKDVDYIKAYLSNGGYKYITTLTNKQATKKEIVSAFRTLSEECRKGDIVYIHFSGHGQQMKDVDGDETDGLDECWIPYDAYKNPCKRDNGEKHLSDDEINILLKNIRKSVGAEGKILVVVDACHSGDSSRGPDDGEVVRGIAEIFDTVVEKVKKKSLVASTIEKGESSNEELWITISACRSYQANTELKNPVVGKLTYSIYQMLLSGKTMDNNSIAQEIKQFVNRNSAVSAQTPVFSGEMNKYRIIDILR